MNSELLMDAPSIRQGWLKLLTQTPLGGGQRWVPRFFVLRGHYLTYSQEAAVGMRVIDLRRMDEAAALVAPGNTQPGRAGPPMHACVQPDPLTWSCAAASCIF